MFRTATLPRACVLAAAGLLAAGCAAATRTGSGSHTQAAASGAGTTTSSTAPAPPGAPPGVARGHLTVTPVNGGPGTTFVLHFTAPVSASQSGTTRTGYTVAVTGGTGNCLGARTVPVAPVQKGATVAVPLVPASLGGRWCAGVHTARVIESQGPACRAGTMCPQFLRIVGSVAESVFTVTG